MKSLSALIVFLLLLRVSEASGADAIEWQDWQLVEKGSADTIRR